jgi:hypothetical protein
VTDTEAFKPKFNKHGIVEFKNWDLESFSKVILSLGSAESSVFICSGYLGERVLWSWRQFVGRMYVCP